MVAGSERGLDQRMVPRRSTVEETNCRGIIRRRDQAPKHFIHPLDLGRRLHVHEGSGRIAVQPKLCDSVCMGDQPSEYLSRSSRKQHFAFGKPNRMLRHGDIQSARCVHESLAGAAAEPDFPPNCLTVGRKVARIGVQRLKVCETYSIE